MLPYFMTLLHIGVLTHMCIQVTFLDTYLRGVRFGPRLSVRFGISAQLLLLRVAFQVLRSFVYPFEAINVPENMVEKAKI